MFRASILKIPENNIYLVCGLRRERIVIHTKYGLYVDCRSVHDKP